MSSLLLVVALVVGTMALDSPGLLGKGWNLGNTLEEEGASSKNPRGEWIFQSLQSNGFDWVRIPVKWDQHTATEAPYMIDSNWTAQVVEVVGWANKHGLTAMINTHHENWLDQAGDEFDTQLVRFVAIWKQVAEQFKGYPDDKLVFEIFNEPAKMSIDNLNAMNAAVLPVIRKTNPTRQVHLGGLAKMGFWWILNPWFSDKMIIPSGDANLALTYHSYSPWGFAGPGPGPSHQPSIFEYNSTMAAAEDSTSQKLHAWAQAKGLKAVVVDEFGVTHFQPNQTERLKYYAANTEASVRHGNGYAVWDDNGWFQILNRTSQQWDNRVLSKLNSYNKCNTSLLKTDTNMNALYPDRDANESNCKLLCVKNAACVCSWFSTQQNGSCTQYGRTLAFV